MAERYKIVVYVPDANADAVREAMAQAGAGRIGNYTHVSFTLRGVGRFRPGDGAKPAIGEVGKLEEVIEERIETVCAPDRLRPVLDAIRACHPYEEPALDVYPIEVV
jgi:hypothetical protein